VLDPSGLDCAALEALAGHGRAIVAARAALEAAAGGLLGAATGGAATLEDWRHYPDGDVHDAVSHAQYFYHAHAPELGGALPPTGAEHGHFHTFMRQGGLSPGVHPLVMPELAIAGNPAAPSEAAPSAPAPAGDPDEAWTHLVAIALDDRGRPLRLFTTNRWVTGETWYAAADVAAASARFAIGPGRVASPLDRWITALIGFYRPLIGRLLAERDAAVMGFRFRRRGKVHVLEDRRLEIASEAPLDIDGDLRRVEAALCRIA
jgi:hypothetical protein